MNGRAEDGMLPQNIEAEQAVIGSLLIDPTTISQVLELLEPVDFYLPLHREIYAGILALHQTGRPADIVLLSDYFQANKRLDDLGGAAYLASLANVVPTSMNIEYYAGIVERLGVLRRRIDVGNRIAAAAYDERNAAPDALDAALTQAEDWLHATRRRGPSVTWEDKAEWWAAMRDRLLGEPSDEEQGLLTGLPSLDKIMRGMYRGDLIIIGARTSVGKTSLSVTIAHHVAFHLNRHVLFFSLEMVRDRIGEKLLSIDTGIAWERLTGYGLNTIERQSIEHATKRAAAAPIDVVPARGYSIEDIRSAAVAAHERQPLSLVVVDYLQKVAIHSRKDNREQTVAAVVEGLKDLALKQLEVPVMALSQLNRDSDDPPRRPRLTDLRESGSIENEGDAVVLLSWHEDDARMDKKPPLIRVLADVAKNRMGETGATMVGLRGPQMQFVEMETRGLPF